MMKRVIQGLLLASLLVPCQALAYDPPSKSFIKKQVEAAGYDYETLMKPGKVYPKTTIKLYTWFTAIAQDAWKAIIADYRTVQPNVNIQLIGSMSYNDYVEKLYAMVVSGTAPNIIMNGTSHTPFFIGNKVLSPLDKYVKADKWQKVVNDGFDAIIKRNQYDGHLYGLPTDIAPTGLFYYNRKLLAKAGLTDPKSDWTLDEFIMMTKKMMANGIPNGFDPYGNINIYRILGGDFVDNDNKPTRFTMGDAVSVKALDTMQDLILKHKVMIMPWGKGTPRDAFSSEKLAFFLSGIWDSAALNRLTKPLDYDVAPPPRIHPGKAPTVSLSGTSLGIIGNTKNQDVSWDFMKFSCGPIGQCYTVLYAQPALRSLFNTTLFAKSDVKPLNKGILAQMSDTGVFPPNTTSWVRMENMWNSEVSRMLMGQKTAAQVTNSLQPVMQKALNDDIKRRKK